jgi:tripartite-type tricarboxylate transporter receptor subunit TctC
MKIITGYPGTSEQLLAIARDECNVLIMSWDTWKTRGQTPIKDKQVALLAVVGLERSPDLPGVPTMAELAPDPGAREVQKFIASYAGIGRAYALPPGVPADRVAAMKKAFEAMYRDPAFVAAATKQKMDLNTATGEAVRRYVMDTLNAPDDVVAKTRAMVGM